MQSYHRIPPAGRRVRASRLAPGGSDAISTAARAMSPGRSIRPRSGAPDRSRMLRAEDVARAAVLMAALPPGASLEALTLLPAGGIL